MDFLNAPDVWTKRIDPRRATAEEVGIKGECGVKFSSPSYACAWNAFVLASFPPVRVWWRWTFRERFVVKGSACGDLVATLLCYMCTALQEQREIRVARDPLFVAVKKIDGAALPTTYNAVYSAKVPKQQFMQNKIRPGDGEDEETND